MARKRKLTIGVVNITIHPHSPERYVELLKDAVNLKLTASIGNLQSALINKVSPYEVGAKGKSPLLSGTFVRFQNIDTEGDWFDVLSSEIAQAEDLAKVNIPANLKPNTILYDFVFFPEVHKLFYEMESKDSKITPIQMESALRSILNSPELEEKYGRVEVTNIPETDKLIQALALKSISNIKLLITRPNADHFADLERQFLNQMNSENVGEIVIEKRAVKGESITVTDNLRDTAKIAEKNGYAEIKGHDEKGIPISFSTKSHPLKITDYFQSGKETTLSFLIKMAQKYLELK